MGTLENRRKLTAVRGMGAALVGFAGWIVLYVVFGLIEPNIFTTNNMLNLLRSMAKYLLVGVGQGVILITGNIDLSIGSVGGMSARDWATSSCRTYATPTPSSRVWARKPATLSRTSSITEKRLASTTPSGLRL